MPAAAHCSQNRHGCFETFNLGDFDLEDRRRLRSAQDNAIPVTTWFSGIEPNTASRWTAF